MPTVASRSSRRIRGLAISLPLLAALGPLAIAPGLFATDASAQPKVTFGGSATVSTTAEPAPASAAGPAAAEPSEQQIDDQWRERDRLLNEPNTITGGTGLLRTQHAQTGAPGQFRLGFITEWFSAGFLCSTDQPCRDPRHAGQFITSDTMNHIGATISLGITFAKLGPGFLDGYVSTGGYANSDDANRPSLLQVLGDTNFGVKYVAPLSRIFHTGLFTELWLINGTGSVGLDGGSTSAKFGIPLTADLRGNQQHTPLRFSLNAIYSLDNTANVLTTTEGAPPTGRGAPVTRIERFGLNVNRVDHFDIRIGSEIFAAEERVRPFLEYSMLIPNNRQGYECKPNNPSQDKCLANNSIVPSTLTLGGRFFPWKHGFSLIAALDVGLSGTSNFIEELQPIPPWTLFIGGGWAIDTHERPPVVRTKTVEKMVEVTKAPIRGHIVGFVHEQGKQTGIGAAVVTYKDHPEMSPLATDNDGKFHDEVPVADYTLNVTADGYTAGTCDAKIPKTGGDVPVDCALVALPKVGSFVAMVRDADSGSGIPSAQVKVVDSNKKEAMLPTGDGGSVKFDGLPAGDAEITVNADNYLTYVTHTDIHVRQETKLDIQLRPRPKKENAQVVVGKKEITIKQQIQFQNDSAVILPESFGLLTEIADTIIHSPQITKIEIQGHTDNTGTKEHNQELSERRAEAVRAWLQQHGVGSDRLNTKGYGQEKPLVPNVTAANRARNRRVQFIIVDQTAPAKP
jgi:outer membrane protein OmpA-like peptidoglycan-associated protein